MTKTEIINYYKNELRKEKISFRNERKQYIKQFGRDIGDIVVKDHEEKCLILKETILCLRGCRK